jgi:hypothetical protein
MQLIRNRGHIVAASPRLDVYGDPDDNFFWNMPPEPVRIT